MSARVLKRSAMYSGVSGNTVLPSSILGTPAFDSVAHETVDDLVINVDQTLPTAGTLVVHSGNPLAIDNYTNALTGNTFDFTPGEDDAYRILVRNEDDAPSLGWLYGPFPITGEALMNLDWPGNPGTAKVEYYVTDLAMNQAGPFYVDVEFTNIAPPAPTGATGTPGYSCMLEWTGDAEDQLYHLRYNFTNDYPDYSIVPPFPSTKLEGIFEIETSETEHQFEGPQDDLYAFGIWTLSNYGIWSTAPNQQVLENNYRIGDFEDLDEVLGSDGCLSFDPEFTALAVAYNSTEGDPVTGPFYNNYLDFAPTSDGSSTGYAQQDTHVDFEDLVIFALNYAWSRAEPACEGQKVTDGGAAASLADVTISAEVPAFSRIGEEFTVPVSISEGAGVAGYHLVLNYASNLEVVAVSPGSVYDGIEKTFFYHDENAAGVDISSVVLSDDFEAGEIAVITFRSIATGSVTLQDELLDVRDWENQKANVEFDLAAKGGSLPTEYSLSQNYPNPFNPNTTIELAMPEAGQYKLTIYNVIGQVVETYEGHSDAGYVTFNWDASGQSSGVYLYKVTAGNFASVRKMVLLK